MAPDACAKTRPGREENTVLRLGNQASEWPGAVEVRIKMALSDSVIKDQTGRGCGSCEHYERTEQKNLTYDSLRPLPVRLTVGDSRGETMGDGEGMGERLGERLGVQLRELIVK
ncbi:hypothetical protein PRIPAC_83911 [Pristionchus pacificus]|uniref:Uncharacterized protein n=1 Tax=Pristionchus pacificus TaxID=54126 RepID=A0A2A6BLC4_PRIPA|nr:hypothetical protein PRIPAC_83911 [Pristionchus pacificus]|eukprot:PDM66714.1 hypothetical protein PRIPAC_48131 [Pristionchus pacificus]